MIDWQEATQRNLVSAAAPSKTREEAEKHNIHQAGSQEALDQTRSETGVFPRLPHVWARFGSPPYYRVVQCYGNAADVCGDICSPSRWQNRDSTLPLKLH